MIGQKVDQQCFSNQLVKFTNYWLVVLVTLTSKMACCVTISIANKTQWICDATNSTQPRATNNLVQLPSIMWSTWHTHAIGTP